MLEPSPNQRDPREMLSEPDWLAEQAEFDAYTPEPGRPYRLNPVAIVLWVLFMAALMVVAYSVPDPWPLVPIAAGLWMIWIAGRALWRDAKSGEWR